MIIKKSNKGVIQTPVTLEKIAEEGRIKSLPYKLEEVQGEVEETKKDTALSMAETIEMLTMINIDLSNALAESIEENLMTKMEMSITLAEVIEMINGGGE